MKDSKGNSIKKGDVIKFNCFGNRTETIVKVKKETLMGCKIETVFIKLTNGSFLEVGANEVTLIK